MPIAWTKAIKYPKSYSCILSNRYCSSLKKKKNQLSKFAKDSCSKISKKNFWHVVANVLEKITGNKDEDKNITACYFQIYTEMGNDFLSKYC